MTNKRRFDPPKPASSEDALAFVRALQEKFLKPDRSLADERRLRNYIKECDPKLLRSIATRVMIDVLKRPHPADRHADRSRSTISSATPADKRSVSKKRAKASSSRKTRRPVGGD
jgi:hypothetical protein